PQGRLDLPGPAWPLNGVHPRAESRSDHAIASRSGSSNGRAMVSRTSMRHNQYLVFVLALVGACDPGKSGSASDGASSSGGGTTDGGTTDGGTTDASPTSSATTPTTGAVATTGAEATGGGTGDTSTGAPLDPDHVALCEAFCA